MSDYSQTRSFNLGIAQETSVEAALIYDDLAYAQRTFGTGKWFYRSYEQLMNRLPYSEQTLRRHIKKLVDGGWVLTKIMKVDGVPICHYQIGRFLSTKLADSKETTKLADSIYNNSKATKPSISSFGADSNSADPAPADGPAPGPNPKMNILNEIIQIVNPKEKATQERFRMLNARLKDYTVDEIIAAARAFSRSDWHKKNKQMSVDNLLAPSKFGRWYAQKTDDTAQQEPERDEEGNLVLTQEQIRERLRKEEEERKNATQ